MSKAVSNKKHKKSLKRKAKNKKANQRRSQLLHHNTVTEKRLGGDITRAPSDALPPLMQVARRLGANGLNIPPEFVWRKGQLVEMKDGRTAIIQEDVRNPLHFKPLEQSKRPDPNLRSYKGNQPSQTDYGKIVGVRSLNRRAWDSLFGVKEKIVINNNQLLWLAADSMIDIPTNQRRNRSIDPTILRQYLKQDDEAQHEITERYSHEFVNLSHTDRHIRITIKLDVMDGSPYCDKITLDVTPQIVEALEPIQQYEANTEDEFCNPITEQHKPEEIGYERWRNFRLDNFDFIEGLANGEVA